MPKGLSIRAFAEAVPYQAPNHRGTIGADKTREIINHGEDVVTMLVVMPYPAKP